MVSAMGERESAQASERQQKEEEQRKAHERDNKLKSFQNERLTPHSPSDFHHHGIDALRKMIENAKPDTIETAGDHWRTSADLLGGQDGHGGIRKKFMDAVDHATAHWEGAAADAFRKEALKMLGKIDRTYRHARKTETSLIGSRESGPQIGLAHNLRQAMTAMSKIHNPSNWESFKDDSGDDTQFHRDMANPKMDARQALELNRDKLSLSKERQVEAVVVMDELASHYTHQSTGWDEDADDGLHGDWPKEPSNSPHAPPVRMPDTDDRYHPDPSSVTPHKPHGAGGGAVPPGFDGPKISRPELPVHTGLDSVQGGTTAPPSVSGGHFGGSSGGPSGGGHGVSGGPGGVMSPGPFGVPGGAVGSGGGRGASGAGGTRGGMPGAGGSGGAKGGKAGAAGRGGAQARTRGGLVGKPGGPAGGAKQGGSGLHRSRGGNQAGMGAAGAKGKDKKGKERTTGQRPDYLVEDEETWTPQRTVAPRVIE
ncbi:hypothetical protein Stsp01_31380 [Streptomyces sp. NBRC 13847]|uniref:hypothetical protein n=2 Tax=Streptomyces TaxID=1883 RepID=UPI0024A53803|nr:hypothetical protein [Streptomyces sp. NBRC 13847]GLW16395.1 hypothetical protein Stsp01_31380 [Streptomyces sp. NBRC 13847]